MVGNHEDRFPFYGWENNSMKRRQSPSPISVNGPSHWYLKSQPIRATLFFQCDGEAISLPNLQGIVVLNITSYAGGVNFWGSSTATTVSMEQGTGRKKGLTPLKSIRKESWTDWSVGEEEVGWGPLLAAAVWWGFFFFFKAITTPEHKNQPKTSGSDKFFGVAWTLNFPFLTFERSLKGYLGHALFSKEVCQ